MQKQQDAAAAPSLAPRLLHLPPELFAMIWRALSRLEDQHALRCSSRAAVEATTPLITSLSIRLLYFDDPEEPRHWDTVGQDAHRILSAFPAAATLRHLRFNARTNDSDADVVLPGLLPSFFLRGAARLAALETVHLEIQAAIGYGDIASLAATCPLLVYLTLSNARVVGHVFQPLERLPALRSLDLRSAGVLSGDAYVGESLRNLTQLTRLVAYDPTAGMGPHVLCMEDLLPHVAGLLGLRELMLELPVRGAGDDHAAAAAASKHLAHMPPNRTHLVCAAYETSGAHVALLAAARQLTSLMLIGGVLDSGAIRALASLPHLSQLSVRALEPDAADDVSELAWSVRTLVITGDGPSTPGQLLRLPLRDVTDLCLLNGLRWCLSSADGVDATCALLRRAAELLASLALSYKLTMRLDWDAAVLPSSSRGVLAALAPLAPLPYVRLSLGGQWDLDYQHIRELATVPSLTTLTVDCAEHGGVNFALFAAELAAGLPGLQTLEIAEGESEPSHLVLSALLAAAVVRARAGLRLRIVLPMAWEKCWDFGKVVGAHTQAAGVARPAAAGRLSSHVVFTSSSGQL